MKTLTERLRESAAPPSDPNLNDEAAAEIENLMLDLQTERAAVVDLRENGDRLLAVADSAVAHQREMVDVATAPLQEFIVRLKMQIDRQREFHAAELADVVAGRDHAVEHAAKNADEVLSLRARVARLTKVIDDAWGEA